MAAQVIEVREHPQTGEDMRIGMGQSQRAARLGVDRATMQRWDADGARKP